MCRNSKKKSVEKYEEERERLKSFRDFPKTSPVIQEKEQFAKHGFFYFGYKDHLKCFSCKIVHNDWEMHDSPSDKKWHTNSCSLANGTDKKNKLINSVAPKFSGCFIEPKKDLRSETCRMSTFITFPEDSPIDSRFLARYGFYYTGCKDRVKCFSCESTVCNWSEHDCPNDRKWHSENCSLALGKDINNKPISKEKLVFIEQFPIERINLSASLQCGTSEMRMEGRINDKSQNSSSAVESQTARVLMPLKPPAVAGLVFASISSSYHQELLTKKLDLHKEEDRRKSFSEWLYAFKFVTPDALAESGFFYLGNSDRVQCFSCTGVLRNWSQNDVVDEHHQIHFPDCKMILKTESRNIPLPDTIRRQQKARKTVLEPADPSPGKLEALKRQFPCLYPVNPHMREKQARLETFDRRWPSQKINATPEHIVKAGFFYLGDRDHAKCWYCNGGLQNWEPNDEPFTEHAKWFPGCEYILRLKGVDFVKQIVSNFPNLTRPPLLNPRFDHKTMKLVEPDLSKNDFLSKQFERKALEMGFKLPVIKQVIIRKIKRTGKNFKDVFEFCEALFKQGLDSDDIKRLSPPRAWFKNFEMSATKNQSNKIDDLKNERMCKNCYRNQADNVVLPCGHVSLCNNCGRKTEVCPICRTKIQKLIKVYSV